MIYFCFVVAVLGVDLLTAKSIWKPFLKYKYNQKTANAVTRASHIFQKRFPDALSS